MPPESYPPPHFYITDEFDPGPDMHFLYGDFSIATSVQDPIGIIDIAPNGNEFHFDGGLHQGDLYDDIGYDADAQPSEPISTHNEFRDESAAPIYHPGSRGVFSSEQKAIIQQYSDDTPLLVLDRLRDHNPAMTLSYKQVKGAVENERRKINRRKDNGPWTEQEMDIIKTNIDKPPKELRNLLEDTVHGFRKNVDQVRDFKNQWNQKLRGRAPRPRLPLRAFPGAQAGTSTSPMGGGVIQW